MIIANRPRHNGKATEFKAIRQTAVVIDSVQGFYSVETRRDFYEVTSAVTKDVLIVVEDKLEILDYLPQIEDGSVYVTAYNMAGEQK